MKAEDPAVRREALYLIADAGDEQDVPVIGQALTIRTTGSARRRSKP